MVHCTVEAWLEWILSITLLNVWDECMRSLYMSYESNNLTFWKSQLQNVKRSVVARVWGNGGRDEKQEVFRAVLLSGWFCRYMYYIFVQTHGMCAHKSRPPVNCGLWVIMKCPCGSSLYVSAILWDLSQGGGCECLEARAWTLSFHSVLMWNKTGLKSKAYFLKNKSWRT